jgi:hypothetical protein
LDLLVSASGSAAAHDRSVFYFYSQIAIETTLANSTKIAPIDVK